MMRKGLPVVGMVIVGLGLGYALMNNYLNTQSYNCIEVTSTERIVTKEESKWMVLSNQGAFQNTDNFLFFKFDSSSIQGQIEEGGIYRVKTVGWRVPLFSQYKNILSIQEADNLDECLETLD